MSLFNENPDEINGGAAIPATGPAAGFMDAFETGFRQSTTSTAQYGADNALMRQNQEQVYALRGAGEENLPEIAGDNQLGTFDKIANAYAFGGDPEQMKQLQDYDDRINELKTKYPKLNLQTTREMWEGYKKSAQDADDAENNQRTTTMGALGNFTGNFVGSVDPEVNPLGFASAFIPVGAEGKGAGLVAKRVVGQGLAQGVSSALEQVTGVQQERQRLGLSNGFGDAISRVAGAAAGGVVAQGAGEAIGAGLGLATKRWFRDVPGDPAPPPPPPGSGPGAISQPAVPGSPFQEFVPRTPQEAALYQKVDDLVNGRISYDDLIGKNEALGDTRMGAARTVLDADHVTEQLNDWGGDYPNAITPQAVTEIPQIASGGTRFQASDDATRAALGRFTVDQAARVADPKTFSMYDTLAAQKNQLSAVLNETRPDVLAEHEKAVDLGQQVKSIQNQLDNLNVFENAPPDIKRQQAKLTDKLDDLTSQRNEAARLAAGGDTPDAATARLHLLDIDGKMRDLAPVVSRAYARVRGEWNLPEGYQGAVNRMVRDGGSVLPEIQPTNAKPVKLPFPAETPMDRAPILQQSPRVEGVVGKHPDSLDYARAIIADNQKTMDEALDKYRSSLSSILKPEGENAVRLAGTDLVLDLDKDKIAIPQAKGEGTMMVSVRDLLEDNLHEEENLKAVTSCST